MRSDVRRASAESSAVCGRLAASETAVAVAGPALCDAGPVSEHFSSEHVSGGGAVRPIGRSSVCMQASGEPCLHPCIDMLSLTVSFLFTSCSLRFVLVSPWDDHFVRTGRVVPVCPYRTRPISYAHAVHPHKCPTLYVHAVHVSYTPNFICSRLFAVHISGIVPCIYVPSLFSLSDVDVLPIVLSNDLCVNTCDGTDFLTKYRLNRSYEFIEIVSSSTLDSIHVDDLGHKYILGRVEGASEFVRLFTHLTILHLTALAESHSIRVPSRPRKPWLQRHLLEHRCSPSCPGASSYLFKVLRRRRTAIQVVSLDRCQVGHNDLGEVSVPTVQRQALRLELTEDQHKVIQVKDSLAQAEARRTFTEDRRSEIRREEAA